MRPNDAGTQASMARLGLALVTCGLVGSAVRRHWRSTLAGVAADAAAAERQRVAADLHDAIAQDLAVIAAYGDQITAAMGEGHAVVLAARSALTFSRSTIAELADPPGGSTGQLLGALGRDLSARFGVAIEVDAPGPDQLPQPVRTHFSRIVREAVANAVRHGHADKVAVAVAPREDGVVLRVVDDGRSPDGGDGNRAAEGFGMRNMRERAAALGGSFDIRRSPAGGTELEVVVP